MIKINELRVGNLVAINNDLLNGTKGEIYKVSGVNLRFDLMFPDSKGTISLDHTKSIKTYNQFNQFIEPIPLNDGWLAKFGFKKSSNYWYNKSYFTDCEEAVEVMTILYNLKSGRFSINDEDNGHPCYTKKIINHVHELQNIYFTLTGEELTVKL